MPTESVTFYFPTSLGKANEKIFEKQAEGSIAGILAPNGQERHILSIARGWTFLNLRYKGEVARAYIMLLTWSSMNAMYDAKKEEQSSFKNLLAPLKDIALLGYETSFYASLRSHGQDQSRCVIM